MDDISYALFATSNNTKIIKQLEEQKKKFFLLPSIKTEINELDEKEKTTLKNCSKFDWIIFTDIFAVDYFIDFLGKIEFDLFDLDLVRICAFGEAVSDRLRFSAIHSDVIAGTPETEKIFKLINDYASDEKVSNLKFLVLKEKTDNIELTEKLLKEKSTVDEISIYRIPEEDSAEISRLKALITGGAIDEIVFSDPADLVALKKNFINAGKSQIFSEIKFSALNETMFQLLYENGFDPRFFSIK